MPPKSKNSKPPAQKASSAVAADPSALEYSTVPADLAVKRTIAGFDQLSAHKQFPNHIKLCRDDVRGRYVACSQPIKAGTVVLGGQKPWAYALNDDCRLTHCDHCNKKVEATDKGATRCSKCKDTVWCSRSCFQQSEALHINECEALSKLPDLKYQGDTVFLRIIIRSLYIRQLQMAYQKEVDLKVPLQKRNKNLAPFKPQPQCLWDELSGLMTHEEKLPSDTESSISRVTKSLQDVLKLSWWDAEQGLYARYLYLILLNNKIVIKNQFNHVVGHGLYLLYFNHSDSPNCVIQYGLNQEITIRAIRDIAVGEELCHAYHELYQPSWIRRQSLRRLFFFDPVVTTTPYSRTQQDVRVKDDYSLAGLKCARCDGGVLDYHQIKFANEPAQITAKPPTPATKTTPTPTPTPEETATATATNVDVDVDNAAPAVKDWLKTEVPAGKVITCYGCKATYPLDTVDQWLGHTSQYLLQQRIACGEASKLQSAKTNLQSLMAFVSKPKETLSQSDFDDLVSYYANTHRFDVSQCPAPLFRLSTTHYITYATYQTLLYIALQQFDLGSVHKFSQLLQLSLSNPIYNYAMSDTYEVLMHLGDSEAFLAGQYSTVTGNNMARSTMIIPEAIRLQCLTKAKDFYQRSLDLRRRWYGKEIIGKNQAMVVIEARLKNVQELLPKAPVDKKTKAKK